MTNELLELYPLTTEVVRKWFMEKMITSFNDGDVPQDFKEFMRQQGVPNDRMLKIVKSNPRILFDVFDENSLFIEIMYMEKSFHYTVSDGEEIITSNIEKYHTRKDCESAAVEQAFKILNDKLNEDGSNSE